MAQPEGFSDHVNLVCEFLGEDVHRSTVERALHDSGGSVDACVNELLDELRKQHRGDCASDYVNETSELSEDGFHMVDVSPPLRGRHRQRIADCSNKPPVEDIPTQSTAQLSAAVVAQTGLLGAMVVTGKIQRIRDRLRSILSGSQETERRESEEIESSKENVLPEYVCKVLVSDSGMKSNNLKLAMLKHATYSVEISGNYCGGECFLNALKILEGRLQKCPYLVVHILCSPELTRPAEFKMIDHLKKLYPQRFKFLETEVVVRKPLADDEEDFNDDRPEEETCGSFENHVKLVIVDGEYFVAGGTNFEDHLGTIGTEDMELSWSSTLYERFVLTASRDMDIVGVDVECAEALRRKFFALYHRWQKQMRREYKCPPLPPSEPQSGCLAMGIPPQSPGLQLCFSSPQESSDICDADAMFSTAPSTSEETASDFPSTSSHVSNPQRRMRKRSTSMDAKYRYSDDTPSVVVSPPESTPSSASAVGLSRTDRVKQKFRRASSRSPTRTREASSSLTSWITSSVSRLFSDSQSDEECEEDICCQDDARTEHVCRARYQRLASNLRDTAAKIPSILFHPELVQGCRIRFALSHGKKKGRVWQNRATDLYLTAFKHATAMLDVAHLNVNPAPQLMQSLNDAVQRGVELRVITTSATDSSTLASHFYVWGNRLSYLPMMTGGLQDAFEDSQEDALDAVRSNVHVFEYDVKRTTYHKKVVISDDRKVYIGSYNLGLKSHYGDDELLLAIESEEISRKVKEILDGDMKRSREISPKLAAEYYFSRSSRFLGKFQRGKFGRLVA